MPTSVHIPAPLLEALDHRARTLGLSRNRLIVRAIERELRQDRQWSSGFLDALRTPPPGLGASVDGMLAAIRRSRRSKRPPRL